MFEEQVTAEYLKARDDVKSQFGDCPEDYKILMLIDPKVYSSIERIINYAGTPHAVMTTTQVEELKFVRDSDYMPQGKKSVYNSLPTLIYATIEDEKWSDELAFAVRLYFVNALLLAYFNEKTKSNSPGILREAYEHDLIIKELLTNNVYKFKEQTSAPWAWQYFQDLTAVVRLLTMFDVDFFYKPPEGVRGISYLNNYMLEAIDYIKKRSKLLRNKHLIEMTQEGFAKHYALTIADQVLKSREYGFTTMPSRLKSLFAPAWGEAGLALITDFRTRMADGGEDEKAWREALFEMRSDAELLTGLDRQHVKNMLEAARDAQYDRNSSYNINQRGTYWSDIWSFYAQEWDIIEKHVRNLQMKAFTKYSHVVDNSSAIQYMGYIRMNDKLVYVFQVDEKGMHLEQLTVLHHHLLAMRQDFQTPLPAFADIIVFKRMMGMHVATFLSVRSEGEQPVSPWDLPSRTRAIQVVRDKDAYQSVLDEEKEEGEDAPSEGDIEQGKERRQFDYSNIKKMTQPQRRAVQYLLTEGYL